MIDHPIPPPPVSARREALERLAQQLARVGTALTAVLVVDVDRFRLVNEALGYAIGDELLRAVESRLAELLRPADWVARVGVDQFLVALGAGAEPAGRQAERILAGFVPPVLVAGRRFHLGVSVGVAAIRPGPTTSARDLLHQAELAVHLAQRRGGRQQAEFRTSLQGAAERRLELEQALGGCLDRQELTLHYQPVFRVADQLVVGAEALLRWHSPRLGLVSPEEFVPVLEETGEITAVGAWVLTGALHQLGLWKRSGSVAAGFNLAVNLSARQLSDPTLVRQIQRGLDQNGLSVSDVTFEITETASLSQHEERIVALREIADLGASVSMDDFGTGYASMAMLRLLPVTQLKIDRLFVAAMTEPRPDPRLAATVIGLARQYNLSCVAEGVESAEQLAQLSALGCDRAQGFHLGRPLPPADFAARWGAASSRSPAVPGGQPGGPAVLGAQPPRPSAATPVTELDTTGRSSGQPAAPGQAVLVADPDQQHLDEVSTALRTRGFSVVPVTQWSDAVVEMTARTVDIVIVDSELADPSAFGVDHPRAQLTTSRSDRFPHVSVIFTVQDPARFDWAGFASLDQADYVLGPVPSVELVRRVSTVAARLGRQSRDRTNANALRTAVRAITEAVRSTTNPTAMVDLFLTGMVDVFDLREASFTTFADDRVPHLSYGRRSRDAALNPLALGNHEQAMHTLAAELWTAGAALTLNSYDGDQPPAGSEGLAAWAVERGAGNSVVVGVGGGASAFGLLWLGSDDRRRRWSAIETSLVQHLASNVAHAMMQSQVTAQQEGFRRLQRLDRAKNDFLETVNHELRTPLTSLTAYLELVQDGMGGSVPAAALDLLDVVARNAKRLTLLVDDVLTISRLRAADPTRDWTPVDLNRLLGRLLDSAGPLAGARGVGLVLVEPGQTRTVQGDEAQLQQVFRNLVDNAVKFSSDGGQVRVRLEPITHDAGATLIRVSVVDTGVGISPDDLPDIFNSFFRGSNAQTAAVAGTGLGLAIVRGLVDAHGGRVAIGGTPGGGTTVTVDLPVDRHHGITELDPAGSR